MKYLTIAFACFLLTSTANAAEEYDPRDFEYFDTFKVKLSKDETLDIVRNYIEGKFALTKLEKRLKWVLVESDDRDKGVIVAHCRKKEITASTLALVRLSFKLKVKYHNGNVYLHFSELGRVRNDKFFSFESLPSDEFNLFRLSFLSRFITVVSNLKEEFYLAERKKESGMEQKVGKANLK